MSGKNYNSDQRTFAQTIAIISKTAEFKIAIVKIVIAFAVMIVASIFRITVISIISCIVGFSGFNQISKCISELNNS